jgi:hypothetical protein
MRKKIPIATQWKLLTADNMIAFRILSGDRNILVATMSGIYCMMCPKGSVPGDKAAGTLS